MKKVYIAGKITGEDYEIVKAKFDAVESDLREAGFKPINPFKIAPFNPTKTWSDYMKVCIKELVDCERVVFLPDAFTSKGAKLEYEIARKLGIEIKYL